ncbi:MAG: CBS domain-containing protein [Limisphaerales bacterium]
MNVKQAMTPQPQCIQPDAPLVEAARRMSALDVGMLPICEDDRLVGTLTDRDIVIRAVAKGVNPNTTPVREVMSPGIIYCFEDQSIEEAAEIMEVNQIRRLPVLGLDKHLVGIISLGDLAVRTNREELAGKVLERVSEPRLPTD